MTEPIADPSTEIVAAHIQAMAEAFGWVKPKPAIQKKIQANTKGSQASTPKTRPVINNAAEEITCIIAPKRNILRIRKRLVSH